MWEVEVLNRGPANLSAVRSVLTGDFWATLPTVLTGAGRELPNL